MRQQEAPLKVSIALTIVSLLLCFAFHGESNLVYDLSLAAFGSAIVSGFIAFSINRYEMRNILGDFLGEVQKLSNIMDKVRGFYFADGTEEALVKRCIVDDKSKDELRRYYSNIKYQRKNLYKSDIQKDINLFFSECRYEDAMRYYRGIVRINANAYIEMMDFDVHKLQLLYKNYGAYNCKISKNMGLFIESVNELQKKCKVYSGVLEAYRESNNDEITDGLYDAVKDLGIGIYGEENDYLSDNLYYRIGGIYGELFYKYMGEMLPSR